MGIYNNILLAVDLSVKHDSYTIQRGVKFAAEMKAALHIIHVIEPIYGYGAVEGKNLIDIQMSIADNARKAFDGLVAGYNIPSDQLILETGSPVHVIAEQAKKLKVDLVIVGAHSKSGLSNLIGSTANGVINQAHCDVLAIRTLE